MSIKLPLLVILAISYFNSFATTYYSDPVNGNAANPGTSSAPWGTLETVLNSSFVFSPGDVILCRDGNHGFPKVNGINTGYVNIQAQTGHTPMCTRIYFGSTSAASYWRISGLTFEFENTAPSPIRLAEIFANCDHISLENCTISSNLSAAPSWTRSDWRTKACTGIWVRGGHNHVIQNNTITNVAIGLINDADSTNCNNNQITNFTIDGIRGNGNNSQYNENLVMDNIIVYTYAENHYDGFQAFTSDTIKNVIFRRNTIICTSDLNRDFRGSMQGMGCFDGFYKNWTIENNLIITDHWHGITLLGAINCRIINNTVIDNYLVTPVDPLDPQSLSSYGPAFIKIAAHKNGQPSTGNYIGNNICNELQNDVGIGTVTNNLVIPSLNDYPLHFVDAPNNDFHLISSSTAIDAGSATFAPTIDIEGNLRPQGSNHEIGAYEYNCSISWSISATSNTICAEETTTLSGLGSYSSLSWNQSVNDGVAFTPLASGYFTATATQGTCVEKDSIYIEVNPQPSLTLQVTESTLCMGESTTLSAIGSYTTLQWNQGVSEGVSFVPNSSGYFTATSELGSCIKKDSLYVEVNSLPIVDFLLSDNSLCIGDSINLITNSSFTPSGGYFTGSEVQGTYLYGEIGVSQADVEYIYEDENGCVGFENDFILIDECATGLNDENRNVLVIRQSKESIEISFAEKPNKFLLLNLNGKLTNSYSPNEFNLSIATQEIPAGVYILQAVWNDSISNYKLLIK